MWRRKDAKSAGPLRAKLFSDPTKIQSSAQLTKHVNFVRTVMSIPYIEHVLQRTNGPHLLLEDNCNTIQSRCWTQKLGHAGRFCHFCWNNVKPRSAGRLKAHVITSNFRIQCHQNWQKAKPTALCTFGVVCKLRLVDAMTTIFERQQEVNVLLIALQVQM